MAPGDYLIKAWDAAHTCFSGEITSDHSIQIPLYLQVGITIMYMMVESKIVDPLDAGGHVLAGYLELMELPPDEFDALKMCVAGRFAQVT